MAPAVNQRPAAAAASEASDRFRQHDPATLDADFGQLLSWLRLALTGGAEGWGSGGG